MPHRTPSGDESSVPKNRRRTTIKARRPAIVDLRFREDAWVVEEDALATVRLGDYALTALAVTSLDTPALNTLFVSVRVGQARRHLAERQRIRS